MAAYTDIDNDTDADAVDYLQPGTFLTRLKYAALSLFGHKPMCSKVYEELCPEYQSRSAGWLKAEKIGKDRYRLSHVWRTAHSVGDESWQDSDTFSTPIAKDTPNVVISTVGSDSEQRYPSDSENYGLSRDKFECTKQQAVTKITEYEVAMDKVCAKNLVVLFRNVRERQPNERGDTTYQLAADQPFAKYHP